MNLFSIAQTYHAAGLAVLPAVQDQKRPALSGWKKYQQVLPTEAEVRQWFDRDTPDAALCLITGAVSGNLELLDFDLGGELFDPWVALVEVEAPGLLDRLVIEQSQSGGRHVIYRCQEPVCGNLHLAQRAVPAPDENPLILGGKSFKPRRNAAGKREILLTLIETRGEGGLFLCHPSRGYELLHGQLGQVSTITAEEREVLLEAAWALNEVIPPPVAVPPESYSANSYPVTERPGDAFNARGDMASLLRQHGWTLTRDGENQYWRRPGKSKGWSATLKGRVFYVFSSNAAPFDGPKAYGPFAVYTMLEHGGDYTRAATALRAQGYGSPVPAPLPPPFLVPNAGTAPVPTLEPVSVRTLVGKYPELRPPILHGLLREGETMNLISAPKVGKSWLVTDLALSIATGRDWLGQFQCERGDVLILDNELHGETSAHRIPKVAAARGIPIDAYADRIWVQNLRGHLQDVCTLGAYFQTLKPGRFKVIIMDAFYRFMPRDMDENDNGTMASLYNQIDRYADLLRCSFVLIHHTTKGNQSGKSVTDVGAGAGSQSRATDTHLVLRPHEEEDAFVLDAAVRSWPPCTPRCLRWSFPVWSPADDLDPTQLRADKPRKKAEELPDPDAGWDAKRFASTFIKETPQPRDLILLTAEEAGLSARQAVKFLRQAEALGVVYRWQGNRNQQTQFSSIPNPLEGA